MRAAVFILVLFLAGCQRQPPSSAPTDVPVPDPEPWGAAWADPQVETPAWLSNGLIGIRIGRDGSGAGQRLFAIDQYETVGEEKITALQNPFDLRISIGGSGLDPKLGMNYRQSLDFRTGTLTTSWNQQVSGGNVRVESKSRVGPGRRATQSWEFLVPPGSSARMELTVAEWLSSNSGPDGLEILTPLEPSGLLSRFMASMQGGWDGHWNLPRGKAVWAGRMLGSKVLNLNLTYEHLEEDLQPRSWIDHRADADIEIDGPVEDQQAIRSFLYYLRSSIHPSGAMSVAPMGLSSSHYRGHVFWDADVWVFPALVFLEPSRARAIAEYRLRHLEQAQSNFQRWLDEGRPTANSKMPPLATKGKRLGAIFPWESSVTGREVAPPETKFQHHITGDVAFALVQAAALGLANSEQAVYALKLAEGFYRNRIEPREDGLVSIRNTMSPDEFFAGDDDLFTNLVAQWCLNGGTWNPPTPQRPDAPTPRLTLPRDETTFLAYEGDPVRNYQQASAVLAIYPLQYPPAENEARLMLERFEPKTSPNGPAMSDSIHALIWARLGERERAYRTWRKSWMAFTRHPLLLFSEKRVTNETYFVTGAAGCLQTVIYGFLGFRIDEKPQPGAVWTTLLQNGKVLSIKPNLPPSWKKVTFKNFKVLGKSYTLEASHDGAKVLAAEAAP